MGSLEKVHHLLDEFKEEAMEGEDVTHIFIQLGEIFELETETYLKQDPDPFDHRFPENTLGHMLKAVTDTGYIIDQILTQYSLYDAVEVNTTACRFLLALFPVYDSGLYFIFNEERFVLRLFEWAENAPSCLQSFATGLLAEAMSSEVSSEYKEKNNHLVPLMIRRLHDLSNFYLQGLNCDDQIENAFKYFGYYGKQDKLRILETEDFSINRKSVSRKTNSYRYSPIFSEVKLKQRKYLSKIPPITEDLSSNERSNSDFAKQMFGSYTHFPSTAATEQKYILKYLNSVSEYKTLLGHIITENTLPLVLRYIDLRQNRDVGLAFEALLYLSSLLNHKKVAIEFINAGGLQILLRVPRPSIAAAGVSKCLYNLGKCAEVMERILVAPLLVIPDIVNYALWLIECSHKSTRCYAAKFFGFGFTFRAIVEEFDQQDGLRKLLNVMSTLNIFASQNVRNQRLKYKSTLKHVCQSLKRYFEAHLAVLVEEKQMCVNNEQQSSFKVSLAQNLTSEVTERNIEILDDLSISSLFQWKPADEFSKLDGVILLLELVSSYSKYYDTFPHPGRIEIIKCALDVLKICSLTVSTKLKFCEEILNLHSSGMDILLEAADGQLFPAVAEVQRSALISIINCVCMKIPPMKSICKNNSILTQDTEKCRDLFNKIWRAVRNSNGIFVLIKLLNLKMLETDADSIRALACKALCGLARSETAKQILCKLPLITNGQLIDLMKKPVLQDKTIYHVQFCKYGSELIETVTDVSSSVSYQSSMNLNEICASKRLLKTKVEHNQKEQLHLMCEHLSEKGFSQTASCLLHEMEQKSRVSNKSPICFGKFPSVYNISWQPPLKKFCGMKQSSESTETSQISISTLSIPSPSVPFNIDRNKMIQTPDVESLPSSLQKPQICPCSCYESFEFMKIRPQDASLVYVDNQPPIISNSTVAEYSQKQQSLRKNLMLHLSPFDLFATRNRPGAHFQTNVPVNCLLRSQKREIGFYNGYRGTSSNTKHIYSSFRLFKIFRNEELDPVKCAFVDNNYGSYQNILLGTMNGEVRVFNVNTAKQLYCESCHDERISHIESRTSSTTLITSSEKENCSKLWNLTSGIDIIHTFDTVFHMEFSKRSLDRVIGTKRKKTTIYDINTFSKLQSFKTDIIGNNYKNNTATFDFSDELVLTDGLLYDVRSGEKLHKLDKFNSNRNGVFHPNGREIISNSEIWDMRTFKLLRTVSGFDQCKVTFNQPSSVIYAVKVHRKMNCFYTFDAFDYNIISTVNVGRSVYHLDCDLNNRFIATIVANSSGRSNVCRLYEVGRTKQVGDDKEEPKEDSEGNMEETSSEEDSEEVAEEDNGGVDDDDDDGDDDDDYDDNDNDADGESQEENDADDNEEMEDLGNEEDDEDENGEIYWYNDWYDGWG